MSFQFSGKTIYIISPEPWGKMRVSKHHYALELAMRGNNVYFIGPPNLKHKNIVIEQSADHPSLYIVSYKPVFRGKRFLPGFLYSFLLWLQIRLLKKKIGKGPDVLFNFYPFLFQNLQWFGASYAIHFATDFSLSDELPPEVFSADFCLAISDTIYKKLASSGKKVYFINHGLNRYFEKEGMGLLAELNQGKQILNGSELRIGYSGNLLMGALDRVVMADVIRSHPEVRFIFWGQYDLLHGNFSVGLNEEITNFVDFLKSSPNVELRGVVDPGDLSQQMFDVDVFWICWNIIADKVWDGSNSHKLLEYLSTGRPVIAHFVSSYKGFDILDMLPVVKNEHYLKHFTGVLNRIKSGTEPVEAYKKRINFALSNTYEKQIDRIAAWINEEK